MVRLAHLILLLVGFVLIQASNVEVDCELQWRKVGCFHDRVVPDRPYPYELVNHRDPTNPAWDGYMLKWKEFPRHLKTMACKCANKTKTLGYDYFGMQFFGECWSGPTHQFFRDGKSDKCIGPKFKPCNDENPEELCVGKAYTNYIYTLLPAKKDDSVDGKWGGWSSWTTCTQKCGGGSRERVRECNNPEPKGAGKHCEGEEVEEEGCNEEECEPVCDKELELGIIMDASSSVRTINYNKMKDFIQKLSDEFVVGPKGVHFGVIHFSWKAHLDFTMGDKKYWSPAALKAKIASIRYTYGGTRTDRALKLAEDKLFCKTCGIRGKDVPKVLIVITDGKKSIESIEMPEATKNLKEQGVTIISIGIGKSIDQDELVEIAKDESHVFVLADFKYLKDKLNSIHKLACRAKFL